MSKRSDYDHDIGVFAALAGVVTMVGGVLASLMLWAPWPLSLIPVGVCFFWLGGAFLMDADRPDRSTGQ